MIHNRLLSSHETSYSVVTVTNREGKGDHIAVHMKV